MTELAVLVGSHCKHHQYPFCGYGRRLAVESNQINVIYPKGPTLHAHVDRAFFLKDRESPSEFDSGIFRGRTLATSSVAILRIRT
jgi:hypothetical protein